MRIAESLEEIHKRAVDGNSAAHVELGVKIVLELESTFGRGYSGDADDAIRWFRLAADRGVAEAENNLGVMYELGVGVVQDYQQAASWYRSAAEKHCAKAKCNLASLYKSGYVSHQVSKLKRIFGDRSKVENPEFVKLLRSAAEQGHSDAQLRLGIIYQCGLGVRENNPEALEWFLKAANQGNLEAMERIGGMFSRDDGYPKQDDVIAMEWFREAAEKGYQSCQIMLAWCYWRGQGVAQDSVRAYLWFSLGGAVDRIRFNEVANVHRSRLKEKVKALRESLSHEEFKQARSMEQVWRRTNPEAANRRDPSHLEHSLALVVV